MDQFSNQSDLGILELTSDINNTLRIHRMAFNRGSIPSRPAPLASTVESSELQDCTNDAKRGQQPQGAGGSGGRTLELEAVVAENAELKERMRQILTLLELPLQSNPGKDPLRLSNAQEKFQTLLGKSIFFEDLLHTEREKNATLEKQLRDLQSRYDAQVLSVANLKESLEEQTILLEKISGTLNRDDEIERLRNQLVKCADKVKKNNHIGTILRREPLNRHSGVLASVSRSGESGTQAGSSPKDRKKTEAKIVAAPQEQKPTEGPEDGKSASASQFGQANVDDKTKIDSTDRSLRDQTDQHETADDESELNVIRIESLELALESACKKYDEDVAALTQALEQQKTEIEQLHVALVRKSSECQDFQAALQAIQGFMQKLHV